MQMELALLRLKDQGYCKVSQVFSKDKVNKIKNRIDSYVCMNKEGVVFEDDAETVRGIHGLHLYDSYFAELCCHEVLLELAEKYINEPVYVHQLKINVKRSKLGQPWPWHEDYVFWKEKDGIQEPNLINVSIFLDDVTEKSGPLCFIPGSHLIENLTDIVIGEKEWQQDVSNQLTYQISNEKAEQLAKLNGKDEVYGKAGDVLIFDPRVAHCSSNNESSSDRSILIITYNAVSNPPTNKGDSLRPEFLCNMYTKPLFQSKHRE